MPERPPYVFLVAGEASGDSHAAAVAREILALNPDARIEALGGPKLEAAGAKLWMDFTEHATMGLFPVLAKLPFFVRTLRETAARLAEDPPDVVVPVDYPGFNLRLARACRARGIPVCFYVSPQVWAWNPRRIHKIGRSVDHMMVLFDFEVELYERIGTPVTHVGHPLFDSLAAEKRQNLRSELGLEPKTWIVGLLPGSRLQEVKTILPELLDAARRMYEQRRDIVFALPIARPKLKPLVEAAIADKGQGLPIRLIDGRAHDVMAGSRVALTASGTATLELAFYGTPMVIVYKVNRIEKVAVPVLGIEMIGLVNIIFGRELCREFLDWRDRSADIAEEGLRLLRDGKRRKEVVTGLREVRRRVGRRGTAGHAARCILEVARALRRTERDSSS